MAFFTIKRVGGLTFWKIGRLGGSFYIARKSAKAVKSANSFRFANFRNYDGYAVTYKVFDNGTYERLPGVALYTGVEDLPCVSTFGLPSR